MEMRGSSPQERHCISPCKVRARAVCCEEERAEPGRAAGRAGTHPAPLAARNRSICPRISICPASHPHRPPERGWFPQDTRATPTLWGLASAGVSSRSWDSDSFCPGEKGWLGPYLGEVFGYSSPSIGIRYFRVLQVYDPLPHVFIEQHRLVVATWGMRERGEARDVPKEPQAPGPPSGGAVHRGAHSSFGMATRALTQLLAPMGTALHWVVSRGRKSQQRFCFR